MAQPYIRVEGPAPTYEYHEGEVRTRMGYHAFFVSIVPFIPSFLSADFTRVLTGEASRIRLIINRQIRFLNDLSSCKSDAIETFSLRFISQPQPDQPYSKVTLFFIGKTFSDTEEAATQRCMELWGRFRSYFPYEEPFNYPLDSLNSYQRASGKIGVDRPALLKLALHPFEDLPAAHLIEIRKYEDRDPLLTAEGSKPEFDGYFPHPFRPTLDISAMGRFLETFAVQPQRCVVNIMLRPTTLAQNEHHQIAQMMGHYHRLVNSASEAGNWLAVYRKERFDDLVRTFEPLVNQRNHLFMISIQILGEKFPAMDVVAALGSEVMNNSTPEPRLWTEAQPDSHIERAIAVENFRLLEYEPWRSVPQNRLWRLSCLVTAYEAVGAFRLPVPSESGHLPGLRVRDEPFIMPTALITPSQPNPFPDRYVALGRIIHRGVITDTDFYISLSQLKRHGLVAGSTGSGKSNTCLHILTELWRGDPAIPFLVIYPIDKPDYRLLQADPSVREKLLIFTLGDDSTSPFRFNPFVVPPGILVRTHMSLLMRAFTAAFSLWDPLPAVYRAALSRAYIEAGFTDLRIAKGGDPGTGAPTLGGFYTILCETAEAMTRDYGSETKGNVRQGAEIRIRDLLQNAGHVLNVEEGAPWDTILQHPTVMEIGRVGSTDDSALIMGFLLMTMSSALSSRRKLSDKPPQHITLIEEAHRLMAAGKGGGEHSADPRAKASEDFANILAEVRGFNEGILIAEQTPTELVSGAIANTYVKIMHWLEEQHSFDLFSEVLNLNEQQRDAARTLPTGQAIMRGSNARPVLVQIANYLDQFQHPDDRPLVDDSDAGVRNFMQTQITRWQVPIPQPLSDPAKQDERTAESRNWRMNARDRSFVLRDMPMKTCIHCAALHRTGRCEYGTTIRDLFIPSVATEEADWRSGLRQDVARPDAGDERSSTRYKGIRARIARKFAGYDVGGILYCYYAHMLDPMLGTGKERLNPAERGAAAKLLQSLTET